MFKVHEEKDAPEGATVIVSGGIAQKRAGVWYSGMEEPMFSRPIQWNVTWWAEIYYGEKPPKMDEES